MQNHIENTDTGIYRITSEGDVFTQTKRKIPLIGKGMEFTGEFKYILEPERKLTYTLNNRGYLSVGIAKKTYMVHRLVALAFIKNTEGKPFVNHIDGNKLNNHINNLEWCTCKENNLHAIKTGLNTKGSGYKIKYQSTDTKNKALANLKDKSKLSEEEVRYVRSVHKARSKEFSATALAYKFNTSIAAMSKIIKKHTYRNIE